ncbi:MAG: DNA-deoxyinosine glycosylase [Burkholderiaceae bacterium]
MENPKPTDRLTGLPPIVGNGAVLLILGSFPGGRSLAERRYYAHPQNSFWRILQAVWPDGADHTIISSYEKRSEWLLSKRLGVWDVYASCDRIGSLDANIRDPVLNDFASLAQRCPQLAAVAHNGAASFKHAGAVRDALAQAGHLRAAGVAFHRLPSTSPANASSSFAQKLAAWRAVLVAHGLVE